MNDITSHINESAELSAVDAEGAIFTDYTPVLATPAAFLGGIAVSSATVAAFEAGQG